MAKTMVVQKHSARLPIIALIPAYNPDNRLLALIDRLVEVGRFEHIIVVNDGSRQESSAIFDKLHDSNWVTVLVHATNFGKGAALKTGLNHVLCHHRSVMGVVTADADGQHLPQDIIETGVQLHNTSDNLILGVRRFKGKIPIRSQIGNMITVMVFRILVGVKLLDTQTGLRGIPKQLIGHLLALRSMKYDFELDMLIKAKDQNIPIRQIPITTVYEARNASSNFNPFWDSLKIYLVFIRFIFSSIVTTIISLIAFIIAFTLTSNLLVSEIALRFVGVFIQFYLCYEIVFHCQRRLLPSFALFFSSVIILGIVSYFMTIGLIQMLSLSTVSARIITAMILYLFNFAVQREFVFQTRDISRKA